MTDLLSLQFMTIANFDRVVENAQERRAPAGGDRAGIHPDAGADVRGKNRSRAANLAVL